MNKEVKEVICKFVKGLIYKLHSEHPAWVNVWMHKQNDWVQKRMNKESTELMDE